MRAIKHEMPDGTVEMFLSEKDLQAEKTAQGIVIYQMDKIINNYMGASIELAAAWEAYRKDLKNLQLLFALSAIIQNLSNMTIALREAPNEQRPS